MSGAQAGLLAGSGAAGYMLAVPVLATLTDRIDARKILIAGSALSAFATLLFGMFATGLWSGALLNAIAGVGFAGAYMPGLKALTDRLASGDFIPRDHASHVELLAWCWRIVSGFPTRGGRLGLEYRIFVTAAGPLVMITTCLLLRPVKPKPV